MTDIAELLEYLTPEERAKLDALLAMDKRVWRPLPGPQLAALLSDADIVGFGGQAGGGKSDLITGAALEYHSRALIIRKEKAQTERFVQRITELFGSTLGYNSQKGVWRVPGRSLIEFGGLDNPNDHQRWQGRDHDLKAFDEVTEQREAQVRFVMGWNRSAKPGQRSRVLMTFNPPTTPEGRWIIKFFAPWLDDKHPNPALPGELRYFTTIGDNPDYEVPDARHFVIGEDGVFDYEFDPKKVDKKAIRRPKSRTFIPASVTDNPFYSGDQDYIGQLQSLPEPLRSQMLYGDFKAGMEDDADQVIPTAWIDAAMDRWSNDPRSKGMAAKGVMDSMGVDPNAGGRDKFVIARRHATWFDDLIRIAGTETGVDGALGGGRVVQARRDAAPVHVDVIGWGANVHTFLVGQGIQSVPINWSMKSLERSREGNLPFVNLRSEMIWRMREALDPAAPEPLFLPDDSQLRSDLAAYRWSYTTQGIAIGSKDDMKKKLGRSPDDGDAVVIALRSTVPTKVLLQMQNDHGASHDRNSELNELLR
ncbi:MAG: terminase large subunit domain-containing protein [Beijerinckiaceae bacterium]